MKKLVKMIKLMIKRFRSVLGPGRTKVSFRLTRNFGQPLANPEISSALDYRDTLVGLNLLCTGVSLILKRNSGQPLYSTSVQRLAFN